MTHAQRIDPAAEPDALDEMVAEFTASNPEFPALLAQATRRRNLLRTLAEHRQARHLSQTSVAATMKTSQPALWAIPSSTET